MFRSVYFGLMAAATIGLGCLASKSTIRPSASSATADAQPADEFDLPDGLEATLWAKTPQLFNPTNIDIDARGRVWVAEGVNYRETWKQHHTLKHPEGDRIVILEDTDGDGKCDSSKVFVQDKDLICPLGIAVLGDKVIVSCSPSLIVYSDTDGDDKADKKEIFLTGFGGRDHDHGLHAVVGGLDGKWYFNVGNDGPHEVKDAGGWWLHSGSCYVYGPSGNTGNRKSDDGRVWTGGLALCIDPDGKHLTPLGHNFRNSYEIALDAFGNLWQSDNDDDGNRSCRTSFLMEGGNMGFFSADGTRMWNADRRPAQETPIAHWHQDDPGVIPYGDITGAGGPTGNVVYEGGLLPAKYIGAFLNANAGRNCVFVHTPRADGAGYRFDRGVLIASKAETPSPRLRGEGGGEGQGALKDRAKPVRESRSPLSPDYRGKVAKGDRSKWFRPSDVAVGTDGAIYVADWYDPMVGGHDLKDVAGEGRIFRIAPRGDRTRAPKIDLTTLDGQLAALNSPAVNVRYAAAIKLRDQPDQAVANLKEVLLSDDSRRRARAIWVLAQCENPGIGLIEGSLKDPDENIRITAFRALRSINHRVLEHAAELADDPSPAVRREAALALRDVPLEQCKDLLVTLASHYDGKDRFYLEALGLACDRREGAVYAEFLARFGGGDPLKWTDVMANLAWRLHPRASIDALAKRAASSGLPPPARQRAIVALAFIQDDRAAEAMARLTISGPDDVRAAASWWMRNRSTNDWKDFAAAKPFVPPAATQPDPKLAARYATDRTIVLDASAPRNDRERAVARLARDHDGAMILIGLASEGAFPAQLTEHAADVLYRNADVSIRALASTYFPRRNSAGVSLPPIPQLAAMKGDASRGRATFFGNTASCAKCHTFDGEGRDIGPDLTAIRTKFARRELLDAILNPSASIAFGYEVWIVKTKDGQVYSGFILADGDNLVLKESSGAQRTIPKSQITLRKKQSISVMPDNVALGLGPQELADLAEFLLTSPPRPR